MTSLLRGAPPTLVVGALIVGALAVLLTVSLGRQALRRLFRVPRIPHSRVTYALLTVLWMELVASFATAVIAALLLRDYQRVDGRTPMADVRCEVIEPGRLRAELITAPSTSPERYDISGGDCVLSLVEVDLRPGLRFLGLRELSRTTAVGSLDRPHINPDWLMPGPKGRGRLSSLLAREAHEVQVHVQPGSWERVVLVASPNGTVLEQTPI